MNWSHVKNSGPKCASEKIVRRSTFKRYALPFAPKMPDSENAEQVF